MQKDDDAICALSTPVGKGAIGLIRVSGKDCHQLVQNCLYHKKPPGRSMARNFFFDPTNQETLDEIMVVFFTSPASFTGQDSVELTFHGGGYILRKALSILYSQGVRAAEPGEFTRRAFLNGKIDLSRAEGIHDLIEAQSQEQWQAARVLTSGRLQKIIEALRENLLKALAYLEAQIDFPDEKETEDLDFKLVDGFVLDLMASISKLKAGYDSGRVAANGMQVVIWGRPNVGKSTLLNRLLDYERALVSDQPGTTRDYLEESCLLAGRLFRFVDTAGIRKTSSQIEAMGIEASERLVTKADLVLLLATADSSEEYKAMQEDAFPLEPQANHILRVWTKKDLYPCPEPLKAKGWLEIAAIDSISTLKDRLVAIMDERLGSFHADQEGISNARHLDCLTKAFANLERYNELRKDGGYEELLAFELQEANRHLSSIIGAISGDEILDQVFSTFCLGK